MSGRPHLALGPAPYFWGEPALVDFYDTAAKSVFDMVYLGEVVCAKRRSFPLEGWLAVGRELAAAGKTVIFSTLALLEAGSELGFLKRLIANDEFMIEANDMAAVQLVRGHPFVAGPTLNIYNPRTLEVLYAQGMVRWLPPVELGAGTFAALHETRPAGVQTELPVWGRMPLAWSARCYTARHLDLAKDQCGFRCSDYPDGLRVRTQEDQDFLVLNGTQVSSAVRCNLLEHLPQMLTLGVEVLRLAADHKAVFEVAALVRDVIDQQRSASEAYRQAAELTTDDCSDGYWIGQPGISRAAAGENAQP
ncbi:MAG TPA: U32 family peptidase [Gammaproteobacteria bacterium]|jgi:collagenase-like PrtC family protease|nr:U32 family peptidase [Arenicellales bacterium]MDP6551145.1 U32 family peptidase [Arenicellales bacterium]MDP6918945.1 U32 family peptidase [Arenicellales bacterium]HCX86869.1 U32 family peptidase [Gammaproteobacteria bacterium]|tara:strand:- start:6339 stop:7256 length:918 start_codon:yes stop_codon:yes gene_type:complete